MTIEQRNQLQECSLDGWQLVQRGADNAKVVSSSLTWTKIGDNMVFLNQYYLHSRSCLLWQSFHRGDVTLALGAK